MRDFKKDVLVAGLIIALILAGLISLLIVGSFGISFVLQFFWLFMTFIIIALIRQINKEYRLEEDKKREEVKQRENEEKKIIEKAVKDKKIREGKNLTETKANYKKYVENQAKEKCIEDLRTRDNRYCCKKCGYGWKSRKSFGEPSICPSCRGDFIVKFYDTSEGKKELHEECESNFMYYSADEEINDD